MNTVYLNGEYLPIEKATVSVLDRGFLFADGVYEVIPVYGGRPFRVQQHLQRLQNSLDGISLANPSSNEVWLEILTNIIKENGGGEQSLYLQVTRGSSAKRDHLFPESSSATVLVMCSPLAEPSAEVLKQGLALITSPDIRWELCNLKTIALLPNVLMRQQALSAGADEAILIRDGYATECTTANLFIVESDVIITPPKSNYLLPGITRDLVLELAESASLRFKEESISESQLANAQEIFVSSSTREVMPVTKLNNKLVGNGQPGPIWQNIAKLYHDYKLALIKGEVS